MVLILPPPRKFEYRVIGEFLTLYEKIREGENQGALRFLSEVSFKGNLESSVRNAIEDGVCEGRPEFPSPMNYLVQDINSENSIEGMYVHVQLLS